MKRQVLSNNEVGVLRVLWEAETPLSRPEILEKMPENNWNPNSIHAVLNNLIKKGYVRVDGVARCGQGYGRTYHAAKKPGEYLANIALQAIPDAPEEESVLNVMSAMIKHKCVGEKTLAMLEQMVVQRREELQQAKREHKE